MPYTNEWEYFRKWLLVVISIALILGAIVGLCYLHTLWIERDEAHKMQLYEQKRIIDSEHPVPTPVPYMIPVSEKK